MDNKLSGYRIEKYTSLLEQDWDDFVLKQASNGTVFHTRNFLNYHTEGLFHDQSIIIYFNELLIAVFPCCKVKDGYFSHSGSTYGGLVIAKKFEKISRLKELVAIIRDYYSYNVGMRFHESIFSEYPIDPAVYLFNQFLELRIETGVYKDLEPTDLIASFSSQSQRAALRKFLKKEYKIGTFHNRDDYRGFYEILKDNLTKHKTIPTHSLAEILDLKDRLGESQMLALVKYKGEILAGSWVIKANRRAWHTFYIATNYKINYEPASTSAVLHYVMRKAKDEGVKFLNFGICTEDSGKVINIGLATFKESLGGKLINRYTFYPKTKQQ
jgi:hypothetical protein